jgi:hypothetical protein
MWIWVRRFGENNLGMVLAHSAEDAAERWNGDPLNRLEAQKHLWYDLPVHGLPNNRWVPVKLKTFTSRAWNKWNDEKHRSSNA